MGRTWWGSHGKPGWWTSQLNGNETSQFALDPYTLAHFKEGIFFYYILYFLSTPCRNKPQETKILCFALAVQFAMEIRENSNSEIAKYKEIYTAYAGDSIVNSWMDSAAVLLGLWVAQYIWKQRFANLFGDIFWSHCLVICMSIAIELVMLLVLRDSFFLSVLQAVRPFPAVTYFQQSQHLALGTVFCNLLCPNNATIPNTFTGGIV